MKVAAPGKLMLSGEWSVLEYDIPCIVAAVNRYVYCEINESNKIQLSFPDFGILLDANFENNKLVFEKELREEEKKISKFVVNATKLTLLYLSEIGKEIKNFKLETNSKEAYATLKEKKIGFGSSAAITVAAVASILAFHGLNIESYENKVKIYKLSALAHYLAQGKIGSSFDIAASTFGNILAYKRFDAEKVLQEFKSKSLKELIEKDWNYLMLKPLKLIDDLKLKVIFSGYSASTRELVLKMREFKNKNKEKYYEIIEKISSITNQLIDAFEKNNKMEIMKLIKENRKMLQELSKHSALNLETPELKEICDIAESYGYAAKFSGAGGGDCAIAIKFDNENEKEFEKELKEKNYEPLNVKISSSGVKII